jgi:hypothetical protein
LSTRQRWEERQERYQECCSDVQRRPWQVHQEFTRGD